jgi:putative ABC transport system substrate-binding protein
MNRRAFISVLGGAAATHISAWPLAARAQQSERVRHIGVLMPVAADDPDAQPRVSAFQRRLQELGWMVGHNLRIDYRWTPEDTPYMRAQAAELVSLKPDLIVAGGSPAVAALRAESRNIPIIFMQVIDPVAAGFVTSLSRPGGNLTGMTNFEFAMGGKWLEILKEISPRLAGVAVLYNPATARHEGMLSSVTAAAPLLSIELTDAPFQDAAVIERAIDALAQKSNGGLLVLPDVSTLNHRDLIIARTAQRRLPAVYPFRFFAVNGGLVSYGIDVTDSYRQIASYVDRILRGAQPEDLPVQAPNKFELIINLKTAKALGLEVPLTLLARADEVIE